MKIPVVAQFENVLSGFCRWGFSASKNTPADAFSIRTRAVAVRNDKDSLAAAHARVWQGPLSASPPVQEIGVVLG